ncbi:MAG: class I SAM-dependent methyltransferase [Kiloniellales bacterium]
MSRSREERVLTEEFDKDYRLAQMEVMRELERAVCGCDYGGTSWTTQSEARHVGQLLGLGAGMRLLEVGAGSGWPGLYLARTTGCDVALVDVPLEGLRIAAERAAVDQPAGECWVILADGAALPFKNGGFDAVSHSDVLCCLEAKLPVLRDCRRVVRTGGRMVFTVISVAPGIASPDYRRALEAGPPFVEAPVEYPIMLKQAGWKITYHADLTAEYVESARRLLREQEARAARLKELLGEAQLTERLAGHRATLGVLEQGLLRRDLFATTTTMAYEPESEEGDRTGA